MSKYLRYFLGLLLLICGISSCKKDEISLVTQQVNSNTNYELRSIYYASDSVVYAAGGSQYSIGVVIRSLDGGHTWSKPDSIAPEEIYAQYFFNASQGYAGSSGSYWSYTMDSGSSYSTSPTNWLNITAIDFSNPDVGVRVGGTEFASGFIAKTSDGGTTWNYTNDSAYLTAVKFADSLHVFVSGYGIVLKSSDAGVTFQPTQARGDFFVSLDFPSANTGYFAGYEGLILKTSDGGNSFQKVRKGNAPFSKRVHFETIKFWDDDNGYVAGDGGVMYKTSDGGKTWDEIKPFTSATLRSIHLFSATSGIVAGDNGSIYFFQQ